LVVSKKEEISHEPNITLQVDSFYYSTIKSKKKTKEGNENEKEFVCS
jgi:hypothetical protein